MRHKEAPYWISWCDSTLGLRSSKSSKLYRTLHLYPGSKAKYDAHQYTKNWIKYFDNVVEDLEPTGIHSVTLDKQPGNAAIYDLSILQRPPLHWSKSEAMKQKDAKPTYKKFVYIKNDCQLKISALQPKFGMLTGGIS